MEHVRIIDESGAAVAPVRSAFETQTDPAAQRLRAEMERFRVRKEVDPSAFIGAASIVGEIDPAYEGIIAP